MLSESRRSIQVSCQKDLHKDTVGFQDNNRIRLFLNNLRGKQGGGTPALVADIEQSSLDQN